MRTSATLAIWEGRPNPGRNPRYGRPEWTPPRLRNADFIILWYIVYSTWSCTEPSVPDRLMPTRESQPVPALEKEGRIGSYAHSIMHAPSSGIDIVTLAGGGAFTGSRCPRRFSLRCKLPLSA